MITLFRCWVESGWKGCVFSNTAPELGIAPIFFPLFSPKSWKGRTGIWARKHQAGWIMQIKEDPILQHNLVST